MTEELKPCPFCGRAVDIENPDAAYPLTPSNVVPEIWQAGCIESEGGCTAHVLGFSRAEAIEAWNKRREDKADGVD